MLPLCSRVAAEPIAWTLAGLQPFAPKCRALAGALLTQCAYVHFRACGGNLWRTLKSVLLSAHCRAVGITPDMPVAEREQGSRRIRSRVRER